MDQAVPGNFWKTFHDEWPSSLPTYLDLGWHQFLDRRDRILEFGYGHGRNLVLLAESGYENLFGYELSPVARMRSGSPHFNIVPSLDRSISSNEKFDVIMAIGVLSVLGSIEELKRVACGLVEKLMPGGRLLLCDYHYSTSRTSFYQHQNTTDYGTLQTIRPTWAPYPFFHFTRNSIESIFWRAHQFTQIYLPSRNGELEEVGFNGVFHNAS